MKNFELRIQKIKGILKPVEMAKAASAQIDAYNDMMIDSGEEENNEDNEEDESDVL